MRKKVIIILLLTLLPVTLSAQVENQLADSVEIEPIA